MIDLRKKTHAVWIGECSYLDSLEWQERLPLNSIVGSQNHLTITLGKRSAALSEEVAPDRGRNHIPIHYVDRGGHATLHNLGQLVIYPKLSLSEHSLGVRDYVCLLQKTTIRMLESLGVVAFTGVEPGIFTEQGKIGFIGVRIRKGVTHHGLSLNVSNDLTDFARIRSCGAWGQAVTSLKTHGVETSLEQVFATWTDVFAGALALTSPAAQTNVVPCDSKELRV